MAPKTKNVLSPEKELKLVRKILKRDYLVNLADIVAQSRNQAIGVEAQGSMQLALSTGVPTMVHFQRTPYDSSGFLEGGSGDCLKVPSHLGGRYAVVVFARWFRPGVPNESAWTIDQSNSGYFSIKVHVNDSGLDTNSLRSTANAVANSPSTTQNASWHLNLNPGDVLKFYVHQSVVEEQVQADFAVCLTRLGAI